MDGGRGGDFHCSVGEREVRELPGLFPGALELGENIGVGQARISRHWRQAPSGLGLRGTSATCPATESSTEPTGRAPGYYS